MGNPCKVKILGTGSCVPDNRITNHYLSKMVDTNDEWIQTRTGIRERRWIEEGRTLSDLCVEASKRALDFARVAPSEVDLVLLATVTPDYYVSCTSAIVADRLGMTHHPGGFDITCACTGFVNAFNTAWHFLKAGTVKTALVIGGETLSRIVDMSDRGTIVVFGDGAGAAVLRAYEGEGASDVHSCAFGQDGSQSCELRIPAGGSAHPITHEDLEAHKQYLYMNGKAIYKFAVRKIAEMLEREMKTNGWSVQDVDLFIPHQVNLRIIESTLEKVNFPMERTMVNIDRYGNTSAASVPIALDEAVRAGRLKRGGKVVTVALGAGLTWSSASFTY